MKKISIIFVLLFLGCASIDVPIDKKIERRIELMELVTKDRIDTMQWKIDRLEKDIAFYRTFYEKHIRLSAPDTNKIFWKVFRGESLYIYLD